MSHQHLVFSLLSTINYLLLTFDNFALLIPLCLFSPCLSCFGFILSVTPLCILKSNLQPQKIQINHEHFAVLFFDMLTAACRDDRNL